MKKPHKIIKFKLVSKNCSYVASPWSNCNIWFAFTFISRWHAITGCVFQRQYIHSKAFFTSGTKKEHFIHLTRYDDIWTFFTCYPFKMTLFSSFSSDVYEQLFIPPKILFLFAHYIFEWRLPCNIYKDSF